MHKDAKCIQTPALLDCWTAWPIQVAVIWPPEWKVSADWESCYRTAVFPSWYGEFDKFSCCRIQLKPSSLQGHSMPNEVDGWLLQPKPEARYFIHSLGKQKAKNMHFSYALLLFISKQITSKWWKRSSKCIECRFDGFIFIGLVSSKLLVHLCHRMAPHQSWLFKFEAFNSFNSFNLSSLFTTRTWAILPGVNILVRLWLVILQTLKHSMLGHVIALKENEPSELKSSQPMMNCAKLMKRGLNFKTHNGHQSTWISAKSSTLRSGHATFQSFPSKATWDHRSQWQAPGRKFKIKDSSFRQMFVKQQNGMKYYERQECFHFLTTRLVRCT